MAFPAKPIDDCAVLNDPKSFLIPGLTLSIVCN